VFASRILLLLLLAADLRFDVASIKPTPPDVRDGLTIQPGGRFTSNGFALRTLIVMAYHLTAYQLSGADGWMANDRWSIEAKAEEVTQIPAWSPPYPPEVMAARLRSLLEDRFQLKTHRETRELPMYTLSPVKNGSKLSAVDPTPGGMKAGPGVIQASAVTMVQFVTYLNRIMDLPVVDQTGLADHYSFKLAFAPDSTRPLSTPTPSDDPSIFDAIRDQLGLELKSAKRPVEVLVVDSASKPSAN
jgi:uncharacterized protein (TIGR03435 family)